MGENIHPQALQQRSHIGDCFRKKQTHCSSGEGTQACETPISSAHPSGEVPPPPHVVGPRASHRRKARVQLRREANSGQWLPSLLELILPSKKGTMSGGGNKKEGPLLREGQVPVNRDGGGQNTPLL